MRIGPDRRSRPYRVRVRVRVRVWVRVRFRVRGRGQVRSGVIRVGAPGWLVGEVEERIVDAVPG